MRHTMQGILSHLEAPMLALVPAVLLACAIWQPDQAAWLTVFVAVAAIAIFLTGYEKSQPGLRQIMPAVVLGAFAAAGRILFVLIPDFKPVAAIAIMAGAIFGQHCGFMVGALAALTSNAFFGQGAWTPWQMYAWGLVGYLGGVLGRRGMLKKRLARDAFGFASCLLYGAILDTWNLVSFVRPITWQTLLINYLWGLPHTLVQGFATLVFLRLIWAPWNRKLLRIRTKYNLMR